MTATCIECGQKLSLGRRLLGRDRCPECQAKHEAKVKAQLARRKAAHDAAYRDYAAVVGGLRLGVDVETILQRISSAAQSVQLSGDEIDSLNAKAFGRYFDEALADDVVTREEDWLLATVAQGLGVRMTSDQWVQYTVAACNAGVMPTAHQPHIMLNAEETAYYECQARLLTKRVITERRTNYASVSFPVGSSGVRYRVGQARGRTVVVGTRTEEADRGILVATSERTVFVGANQVMEFPHRRLVGLNVFTDGVGLQIANRQSIPTFQTGKGPNDVLAAVLHTAVAASRGTFQAAVPAPVRARPVPPAPAIGRPAAGGTAGSDPPGMKKLEGAQEPKSRAAHDVATGTTTEPSPDRAAIVLQQLGKFPGYSQRISEWQAAFAVGAMTLQQLKVILGRLASIAEAEGWPPSLKPLRPEDVRAESDPVVREPTPAFEAGLAKLQEFGLTTPQAEGLREDFRRGRVEEQQLPPIARSLAEVMSAEEPTPDSSNAAGQEDEIKDVAERNVSFRQTMVSLDEDVGHKLLGALRSRSAPA